MFTVLDVVEVIDDNCIGCMKCDQVCPTGAIVTIEGLARVDQSLCTGCNRCITECYDHGAIKSVPLETPREIRISPRPEELDEIKRICAGAKMGVKQLACPCTLTTAGEIATAILRGAKTPDEAAARSGARSSCSIWCTSPIMRLLESAGVTVERSSKDWRVYTEHTGLEIGLWSITDEVAEKYPEYRLKENRERLRHDRVEITCFGSITKTP